MKKLSPILTLLFQIFITFGVLFVIYLIYALADVNEADMINSIGFLLFQPLFGLILASITIAVNLLLGLPIRLIERCKQWWYTKPGIPLLGSVVGVVLLILAFFPAWRETQQVIIDGESVQKQVPNSSLAITGWCMTAFSLLHFFPQSMTHLFRK